jgi:hypothetical protein
MAKVTLEVLNPRAKQEFSVPAGLFAPRPASLDGKRIAILPEKFDSNMFFDCLQELIQAKYPTSTFLMGRSGPFSGKTLPQDLKGNCDLWIEGVKTTGSWENDDEVELELAGIPGVVISIDELVPQRKRLATVNGVPGLRVVGISSEKFYTNELSKDKIMAIAQESLYEIINALTSPLTAAEKNPVLPEYDYSDFSFEGETYIEAFANFQTYFAENELSDGLAVAPPTREAVRNMLSGTSRPPQEILGKMHPGYGVATVEKVAINAVMAGAKPEYFPVIVAAVEALCDPSFDENHIQIGLASTCVLIGISGPIAKELGMNTKAAYLGPGTRSNNTIGRAVSLCMFNIGWGFPAFENMWLGNASRFCNMVIAENLDDSPWESWSEYLGYAKDDSTVTVDEVMSWEKGPTGATFTCPLEEDIQKLSDMVKGIMSPLKPESEGAQDAMSFGQSAEDLINSVTCSLVIYPSQARQLAAAGYSRKGLVEELCRRHRISWDALSDNQKADVRKLAESGKMPSLTVDDCKSGGTIPTVNPNKIAVYVTGPMAGQTMGLYSYGNYNNAMRGYDPTLPGFCTKKIHGATLTQSGK